MAVGPNNPFFVDTPYLAKGGWQLAPTILSLSTLGLEVSYVYGVVRLTSRGRGYNGITGTWTDASSLVQID